jgi:hypothetical protein
MHEILPEYAFFFKLFNAISFFYKKIDLYNNFFFIDGLEK